MSKPISSEKRKQWEDVIRQQQASGLSVRRWCHENQIIETSFRYWKDRLYPKPLNASCFTELSDTPTGTGISLNTEGYAFTSISVLIRQLSKTACLF